MHIVNFLMTKKRWLILAYLSIYMYVVYVFWMPWYCSVEARYARDNLAYISGRLADTGVVNERIETGGNDFFHWSYDRSLKKIFELSSQWGDAFIEYAAIKDGTGRMDLNPYDTLSRLKYDSLTPEVQAVYKAVMMRAAITNPDKEYTLDLLSLWMNERKSFDEEATEAFNKMEKQKILCSVVVVIASVPAFMYLIMSLKSDFILILKKHNNSVRTCWKK